jgi:hypothetical protein
MKAKLKPRPADIPQLVDLRMYLERWPDDAATHAYRYTGRPFQSQLEPGASRRKRRRGEGTAEEEVGYYEVCLSLSTLFSRSIPTRYLLRNLWPTIPPS